MTLNDLIKRLEDMKLLYKDAIVRVDIDGVEYRVVSINGFTGEHRPGECQDPNRVIINVRLL